MDMYGLSKNTLGDWIKNKKLPHYKVEKKVIFKISDLEDFLKKYRRVMPAFIYYFSDVVEAAAAIAA
jgi:excisionase family DNA binding protein